MEPMPASSDVLGLGPLWLSLLGLLAAFGIFLFVTGLRNFFRGKFFRGPLRGAFGVALGGLAIAGAGIGMNLHTYNRLNYEEPVARIEFMRVNDMQFQALLRRPDGKDQAFGLFGNQFQVDARVLKWSGAGSLLGLDPRYRLERLSGRYAEPGAEQTAPRSVYGLKGMEKGVDIAGWSERLEPYLPLVDTVYGSAAYMPMADGAVYEIIMTEDALVARPANEQAQLAVSNWR